MLTKLKRIIKSGWISFRRNGMLTVATLFVMVLTIFLATTFFLLQGMTNSLIASLQDKVDISVSFKKDTLEEDITKLKDELLKIPEVKNVAYVSSQQALDEFTAKHKDDAQLMESLAELGENPFPAYLNIKASTPGQYEAISNFLGDTTHQEIIDKVNYYKVKQTIDLVFSISSFVKKSEIGAALIFGILAILITFNTIRLAISNSKEEIAIMRLVGASNWFIRGPFIVQGVISGLISILITNFIFLPLFYLFISTVKIATPNGSSFTLLSLFSSILFNPFHFLLSNFGYLLLLQILVGIGIGVFSSLIAIRKHLQV